MVLYIFLVRITNVLVDRKRKAETKTLAKKIFELEQKIGEADGTSRFVYDDFIRERERYYVSFAMDSLKYQK